LEIWSGGVARDNGSHRVFGCPAYVDVKKDILNSKVNKLVFLGYKKDLKATSYGIRKTRSLSRAEMSHWMRLQSEAYHLSTGGDREDQVGDITAGGE